MSFTWQPLPMIPSAAAPPSGAGNPIYVMLMAGSGSGMNV